MDSDDDFVTPSQLRLPQISRSQTVTSSSSNRTQNPGTSRPVNRSQAVRSSAPASQGTQISQERLSQLQDGIAYLTDQLHQLTGDRGVKRPAELKPNQPEKKPNVKEQCHLCKKLYKNKTTLFRHYYSMHKEMNPEKYHGYSINDTVVSLDTSFREIQCSICSYIAPNQSSFDDHNRTLHSNVATNAAVNSNNKENVRNSDNITVKDKMHKCEDCACYFDERSKFDEHMKVQHCFEVACKICNKNLLFKDIDAHVKHSHPDVYNKKEIKGDNKEKIVVEKVMRNRKGKKVRVFTCTKCGYKMYNKINAKKHANGHLRLKIKAADKSSKAAENRREVSSSNDISNVIFTCDDCNVSTNSYDVTVEHSQNHITNVLYKEQCVTQTCLICELKFEPLCYKKHMDLHYNNKEIHKESFKYCKYKFQTLLTENWFDAFDMTDPSIKSMISESIYAPTLRVKMRVMNEGVINLYKCCQCDNFVEPAAVANHTVNYDTCLKVKGNFACDVCKRNFNNRLARDRHVKDHNGSISFKIIIFNNERDKEFNTVLNDPNTKISDCINKSLTGDKSNSSDANDYVRVYKCLCGLCFVRKETADIHSKICPGKDQKQPCPKCNNFFNSDELLVHCFEHHLNESKIIIENIVPNVIVLDSDEEVENGNDEVIEISDDEEDLRNECSNDTAGTVNANIIREQCLSEKDTTEHNVNTREKEITETTIMSIEQIARVDTLHIDNNAIDERNPEIFDVDTIEAMDDDSQDTICYENVERLENDAGHSTNEIKCVPTSLLLNPFRSACDLLNSIDTAMIKNEIIADIENVRQNIEDVTESLNHETFNNISIKKEKPWLFNPTDFSNICGRRSLRQIEPPTTSRTVRDTVIEILLTDDEDEVLNTNHQQTENVIPQKTIDRVSNISQTTTNTDAEVIRVNEGNTANSFINEEMISGENDSDDDDLFLPSNNQVNYASEPRHNEKEITLEMCAKQLEDQVDETINTTLNVNDQEPLRDGEDIHSNDKEIHRNDASVNGNEKDATIYGDTTRNDLIEDTDPIAAVCDKIEANDEAKRVKSTNNNHTLFENPEPNLNREVKTPNKVVSQQINIEIKRELLEPNEYTENNCDIDLLQIKTEPNEKEFNRSNNNLLEHNDKNCTIC